MNRTFTSVPFKAETGFWEIDGIGKFSPAGIVLELESKLLGLFKGTVKEYRIGLDEILDVRFRKGFLKVGSRIEIRLKSISKLAELPSQSGKVTLKIKRGDFEAAREAVDLLEKELAAYSSSLPPTKTSVTSLFDENTGVDTKELNEAETKELE